jgi:hypothetical protein
VSFYPLPKGLMSICLAWAAIVGLNSCTEEANRPGELTGSLKRYSQQNLRDSGKPYCDQITFCRSLVEIRCHPELDGPVNYVDVNSGNVLARCGGFPGLPNQACPPVEWKACIESPTTPH